MIFITVCLSVFIYIITRIWLYFRDDETLKRMGLVQPNPFQVFKGAMKYGIFEENRRGYENLKKHKMYGIKFFRQRSVTITDLDLARDVMVKQFQSFHHRRQQSFKTDCAIDYMMPRLEGEKWKNVRSAVSPAFSTNRLKMMSKHVQNTTKLLVENVKEKVEKGEEVELKEFMGCFAMDAIASAGFGVSVNSIKNPNDEYVVHAKRIMPVFVKLHLLSNFVPSLLLNLFKKFGIDLFDKQGIDYFETFVDRGLASRKEEGEDGKRTRNDFLQLMIDSEREEIPEDHDGATDEEKAALKTKTGRKSLTKLEIQGQSLSFFLASYENVATSTSIALFLISNHPEILKKVQDEIDEQLGKDVLTYDKAQQSLPYLDMCIAEGLRMYPPIFILERRCSETTELQGVKIPKDMMVSIPVMGIHYDPDIYPEPDKFIPERFSPEAKEGRHPFSYLPFGHGPRNCIGMRLALLEMKMAIAGILQSFSPVPCEKTVYPVVLQKFRMQAKDGLWTKFQKRETST